MGRYLTYISQAFYREDVPYLSDEEFQDYERNGEEAASRFSEENKSLWKSWSEQRANKIEKQLAHKRQWLIDMAKILPDFSSVLKTNCQEAVTPSFKRLDKRMKRYFRDCLRGTQLKSSSNPEWVKKQSLIIQCFLLAKIQRLSTDPQLVYSNEHGQAGEQLDGKNNLLDHLYPFVCRQDHLFLLESLIYDFGYGPNAFPWKDKRVEKGSLCGVPIKLYLVEIDVGRLTGGKSCHVRKIGITSKNLVVGPGLNARFSGKFRGYVKVLREKLFENGEIAYIKEQAYLDIVAKERTISLGKRYNYSNLTEDDLGRLGETEWVLEGRPRSLAIEYFDLLIVGE